MTTNPLPIDLPAIRNRAYAATDGLVLVGHEMDKRLRVVFVGKAGLPNWWEVEYLPALAKTLSPRLGPVGGAR